MRPMRNDLSPGHVGPREVTGAEPQAERRGTAARPLTSRVTW
jgi:hypothetical protein